MSNYKKPNPVSEPVEKIKSDKRIQKFMKEYRYQYRVTMLPDLAELAYSFYLEGYHNGLGQFPVVEATDSQGDSND